MKTIQLDLIEERAMAMIRYLENVGDVRVTASSSEERAKPPEVKTSNEKKLVKRDWYGILADHPGKDDMLDYFDKVRDEWEDRY